MDYLSLGMPTCSTEENGCFISWHAGLQPDLAPISQFFLKPNCGEQTRQLIYQSFCIVEPLNRVAEMGAW
jgi:hypothetical protein